jgi:hypothetical protein
MASRYPYDSYETGQTSLQANADEVTATLHDELQLHLRQAGVEVFADPLTLARLRAGDRRGDAPPPASRSRRCCSSADRRGAVGIMVDHALELLSRCQIVSLDEERKASMVSNLLVVLCSESRTQPVVNTGTLYQ